MVATWKRADKMKWVLLTMGRRTIDCCSCKRIEWLGQVLNSSCLLSSESISNELHMDQLRVSSISFLHSIFVQSTMQIRFQSWLYTIPRAPKCSSSANFQNRRVKLSMSQASSFYNPDSWIHFQLLLLESILLTLTPIKKFWLVHIYYHFTSKI